MTLGGSIILEQIICKDEVGVLEAAKDAGRNIFLDSSPKTFQNCATLTTAIKLHSVVLAAKGANATSEPRSS